MKRKILILGPTPPPMGGIATYVGDMLKSKINEKYDILYVNTNRHFLKKETLLQNLFIFSKNLISLVYLISIKKPIIAHIHTSSYMIFWERSIFLIISKILSVKVIIHIHGGGFETFYQKQSKIKKLMTNYVLNLSDSVFVLSKRWEIFFSQIVTKNKIVVIPNGVYSELYTPNILYKDPRNESMIQILFAGFLSKNKGIYDILNSIPHVIERQKNVLFVFAGVEDKPGETEKIKRLVKDKKITQYVLFTGMLSKNEMATMYKKSDISILPSYIEGLPISLLEAMASGLPIISTPVGGIPEIIEEGKNGFLITPGDYMNLANKICNLIDDRRLRIKIGERNRQKIKDYYDWEILSKKISVEYEHLANID